MAESKKFRHARRESLTDCTNATLGTSRSQARSVVVFAMVMTRRWISLSDSFIPARYASSRTRSASLNTTRQQPNTRASISCWAGVGSMRYR